MKKIFNKKDVFNIFLMIILFVLAIFCILQNKYIWGSYTDWISQHSVIPEYFRVLFYSTHDILPDLALNLGAGQNIYNFAYYGLLNPVIMISYLLPFVSMKSFLMFSSLFLVLLSGILFYIFLRKHNYNSSIAFISSICFLFSNSLIFHSHRHIMFINYMPFLILGLFGVDRYFDKKNGDLISLSVFLIILMSYYYSIPSIICLIIYGIYVYIDKNENITFKVFLLDGVKFLIPILVGIIMSSILILPEFYVVLNNRMSSIVNINFWDLIIPKINISYIVYNPYGIGFTSIIIFALLNMFFKNSKKDKFLIIVLSFIILFPLFNYLLNATMYIDSKSLIPFLPLYALVIAIFFKDFSSIDLKKMFFSIIIISFLLLLFNTYYSIYIFLDIFVTLIMLIVCYKFKKENIFMIYICLLVILFSIIFNSRSNLILKDDSSYVNYNILKESINDITSRDNDFYRITTLVNKKNNSNEIFGNINMYQNYLYSSLYDINYNKFYYDVFNNIMQSRNRLITTANSNVMFLMFMNNKYLLSNNSKKILGYSLVNSNSNINVYKNDDVLSYMYVAYNNISYDDFNKMSFPYNNEVLLNNVVSDNKSNNIYKSNIVKLNNLNIIDSNTTIYKNDNLFEFKADSNSYIKFELPDYVKNKIIFIKFKMNKNQSCDIGDQYIIINGDKNTLTCKEWKYYNQNEEFTYVLSYEDMSELDVRFSKGFYSISDIELYYLDYNTIKNISNNVTKVNIDKVKTKGDYIYASVDNIKDGYFVTTIPYQKGFSIYIDNEKIEYENVNAGFIGFKIEKGKHDIKFVFNAPLKNIGLRLSIIGFLIFIYFCIIKKIYKK